MTHHLDLPEDVDAIAAAWREYRDAHPGVRRGDAAEVLGVSEVALVASECGAGSTRLVPYWESLLREIRTLGRLRATVGHREGWMARCVAVRALSGDEPWRGETEETRYLVTAAEEWTSAFAVTRDGPWGRARGLAMFDAYGATALELIVPDEYWPALDALIAGFGSEDQSPFERVRPDHDEPGVPNDDVDVAGLRAEWDALTPERSFERVLRRAGIGRAQAYRLAGRGRAEPIDPATIAPILLDAAARTRPIALRIFGRGASCAYFGAIAAAERHDGWIVAQAPCMAAAFRPVGLAAAWAVERPGRREPSVALEGFDALDRRVLALALPRNEYVDYV